jgi:serine/threonine protein kinase
MQRRQFYSVTDALQLLRPVALALDYAHSRGFVHGDVKPENVLFDVDRSHPFLSDFGSTRRAAYDERISAAGAGRGTTIYLSPEQIRDSAATASSDVYAFGMVAYEMLTGRMPVDEREPAFKQMIAKIEGRLLPAGTANGQLPKHVAGALMAALAVDPRDRPATTSQLCAMLAGELALPRPSRAFGRRRLTTSQRAAIITATIAAIGTIVVAVIESLPRWRESSAPAATQAGQPRR